MKILLINNNPVVSRLTALSARKEDIEIEEIQEVTELNSDTYDIIFVDADSLSKDVRDAISENIKTQKTVLFYADGDEEEKASFDLSILKPFLPSEVSAVIRSIEETSKDLTPSLNEEKHFNILDDTKVDNRTELFDLDGLDEIEEKKEEVALNLDENLDLKLEDVTFNDKLEDAFPLNINTLDDDLLDDTLSIKKPEEKVADDLFDLDLSDEIPSLDDDLFAEDKKEKKSDVIDAFDLDDDVLEVKSEKEEVVSLLSGDDALALELDEPAVKEVKKGTQILDELEMENIKNILTEDTSDDMTLEDVMPVMAVMPTIDTKKESKIEKKELEEESDNALEIDSNVLAQTFASMPVDNLRELLAGAKINIKIKFPKSK
ncbi:MAG TPA: hypothetical protein EYG94_08520 [Campylobacterales bacterium]|nr:hypothetical protein [Campylobacterales bacterium]